MKRSYVKAKVQFYPRTLGGRSCVPFGDGYAPYLRASMLSEDLAIRINGMPSSGQYETEYEVELELSYHPRLDYSQLIEKTAFKLIEGPRIVGRGVITSPIYERLIETPNH